VKTVAFFNNKGGVGKTSLVFHLCHMYADLGYRVIGADLDPQSNLTAMCFSERKIEEIYEVDRPQTIYTAVEPLRRGVGDVGSLKPMRVTDRFSVLAGDLLLSDIEDQLSENWPKCMDGDERAFRVTTSLARVIYPAAANFDADLTLIDMGPNFGALNRSALICADYVVIPVAPDLFSIRGLQNVGARLRRWREEWQSRLNRSAKEQFDFLLPSGDMQPIGYVISRYNQFGGGAAKAFDKWIARIPAAYSQSVGESAQSNGSVAIASLKDFRSLSAMAQEARKPMFKLKPADGAIGGHQSAVSAAYSDYREIALKIAERIQMPARVF